MTTKKPRRPVTKKRAIKDRRPTKADIRHLQSHVAFVEQANRGLDAELRAARQIQRNCEEKLRQANAANHAAALLINRNREEVLEEAYKQARDSFAPAVGALATLKTMLKEQGGCVLITHEAGGCVASLPVDKVEGRGSDLYDALNALLAASARRAATHFYAKTAR